MPTEFVQLIERTGCSCHLAAISHSKTTLPDICERQFAAWELRGNAPQHVPSDFGFLGFKPPSKPRNNPRNIPECHFLRASEAEAWMTWDA